MSKLDQFLKSVFTEGQYQDTGSFTLDNLGRDEISVTFPLPAGSALSAYPCADELCHKFLNMVLRGSYL